MAGDRAVRRSAPEARADRRLADERTTVCRQTRHVPYELRMMETAGAVSMCG